jgi:ATP-dependent exoDNAse (exonuclease V) alpha subunit
MAIMHFRVSHVSRSTGRSSVQSAAYITGEKLRDERTDEVAFYRRSEDGVYSWAVMAPEHAGSEFKTLEGWNKLERFEDEWANKYFKKEDALQHHKNSARISMNIIGALPRELTLDQSENLVRQFVQTSFVDKGHYVTYALHNEEGNPHVHMMISHRSINENGEISDKKNRELCSKAAIKIHRQAWANVTNQHLELNGIESRISEKSYVDLGIDLIPTIHEGWYAQNLERQGTLSFLSAENQKIRDDNQNKILENPMIVLDLMTKTNATFTMPQLLAKVRDIFPENEKAISYVYQSIQDNLVTLGEDVSTEIRFTSKEYQEVENKAIDSFNAIKDNAWGSKISDLDVMKHIYLINEELVKESGNPEAQLNREQRQAIEGICQPHQVSVLVGRAGAGKTTSMRAIKNIFEEQGCQVVGSALSASAAKNLGDDTGCFSETVRFYIHKWDELDKARAVLGGAENVLNNRGEVITPEDAKKTLLYNERYDLTNKSVFLVDEASMVGMRDWRIILDRIESRNSKLVIVGDGRQFSPVDSGDMHRYMEDNIRGESRFVLSDINRQKIDYMRAASVELSNQNVHKAIAMYENKGHVIELNKDEMIQTIAKDYVERYSENKKGVVLSYTNDGCYRLNNAIRASLQEQGLLSKDEASVLGIKVALGDKVVFLENQRRNDGVTFTDASGNIVTDQFIRNGTQGTVESIIPQERDIDGVKTPYYQMTINLSNNLKMTVDTDKLKSGDMSHGYALTIHKSQGQTVDWCLVVASKHMDASAVYVAMTRHRYDMKLYYSTSEFESFAKLQGSLSRASYKDMAKDYHIGDKNKVYFNNVESYRLITMEMADLLSNEDVYSEGEPKDRLEQLEELRGRYADDILNNYDKHALYVSQAKLTKEKLEIITGKEERPLSNAEKIAKERVLSYINLVKECRSQWDTIVKAGGGATTYSHPVYSKYENTKQLRDASALEIYLNKPLHRPFMREIGEALNYGFGVLDKQARHALYRAEFKEQKLLLDMNMMEYRLNRVDQKTKEFWDSSEFAARGQAAMQIIATHLYEKSQNLPKLTMLHLQSEGLDFLKVRQDAFDYNRIIFARNLQHSKDQRHAELVAIYDIVKRQAAGIYSQCAAEIKEHNDKVKEDDGKLSFWHAKDYQSYTEAVAAVNKIAYNLSKYDEQSTQALANLFGVNISKLEGQCHMGELQHLVHQFKASDSMEAKAQPAAELVSWLAMDKEFKNNIKGITGQSSPTYQLLQREKVDWSVLFNAAQYHKVSLNTEELTPAQIKLSEHVFHYNTTRPAVGKAYAAVMEEHTRAMENYKERLAMDPTNKFLQKDTPKIFKTEAWSSFMDAKEILNSHADILYKASPEDRQPFMEIFRLNEDQLKRQSTRHEMTTAIKTVLNREGAFTERASAYLQIQRWEKDNLDKSLAKMEKNHKGTDLSSLKEHTDKDLTGLIFHFTKPNELTSQGEKCLEELKKNDPVRHKVLQDIHQFKLGERQEAIQRILENANKGVMKEQPLDHNIERLQKAQSDYQKALGKEPVSFQAFKSQQLSIKDIEVELKDKIVPLTYALFAGEKLYSKSQTVLKFGNKGSKSVLISGNRQGVYMDFETGEKGNAFKMIQDRLGLSFKDALNWSQEWLGNPTNQQVWESFKQDQHKQQNAIEETRWVSIYPAPKEPIDITNHKYLSQHPLLKEGKETLRHAYKDADSNILGYVIRIEQKDGSKTTLPLTYCKDLKTNTSYWKWKGFGQDAPLYGLDQLAAKPIAPILVVEGEKAADAARQQFKDYAVISWPSGSGAVTKADWSPIKGRDVVMWPDNDKAGFAAASKVVESCEKAGASSISIVRLPEQLPQKWDLADAYPKGFDKENAKNLLDKTLSLSLEDKQLKNKIDELKFDDVTDRSKKEAFEIVKSITKTCDSLQIKLPESDKIHLAKQGLFIAVKAAEIRQDKLHEPNQLGTFVSAQRAAFIESIGVNKTNNMNVTHQHLNNDKLNQLNADYKQSISQVQSHIKKAQDLPESLSKAMAESIVQTLNLCPALQHHVDKLIHNTLTKADDVLKVASVLEKDHPSTTKEQIYRAATYSTQTSETVQQAVHKTGETLKSDVRDVNQQIQQQQQQYIG